MKKTFIFIFILLCGFITEAYAAPGMSYLIVNASKRTCTFYSAGDEFSKPKKVSSEWKASRLVTSCSNYFEYNAEVDNSVKLCCELFRYKYVESPFTDENNSFSYFFDILILGVIVYGVVTLRRKKITFKTK